MAEMWRKKRLNVKTYEPKKRIGLRKEEVVPRALSFGSRIASFGNIFLLFFSAIFSSVKAFFTAKDKMREYHLNHEKVMDLRKRNQRIC